MGCDAGIMRSPTIGRMSVIQMDSSSLSSIGGHQRLPLGIPAPFRGYLAFAVVVRDGCALRVESGQGATPPLAFEGIGRGPHAGHPKTKRRPVLQGGVVEVRQDA